MADLSNEEIIQRVQEKLTEKNEVIREQLIQLQQKEESLQEKDRRIQELEAKIAALEQGAGSRDDLIKRLNEVLE